jgi:MtN3 and saliva related transmembrane protein
MGILSFVGSGAAVCTTGAFIPQILKIRRQGGRDLSYLMLFVYLTGVLLWLVYGLMLHAAAIIWANAATSFLVMVALALKVLHELGASGSSRRN